jgi:hypothetical protein
MAEPALGTATGTEISDRSSELVLPSLPASELPILTDAPERKAGLSDPAAPAPGAPRTSSRSASNPSNVRDDHIEATATPEQQRGVALPGDRGPRIQAPENQRPSFWRRIAIGSRRTSDAEVVPTKKQVPNTAGVEQRIVEPLLQALVSVESKLERSHVELTQKSDQVEQRLTQLWDIEEQLGTLVELQESLLNVSEQQRRVATAVESQTRTLRWLVGSIFFSLAVAAFVVAAVLR